MIRILLVSVLLCCIFYGVYNSGRSRSIGYGIVLFGLAGVYFVFVPEKTTILANYLGVGRGADLIVYCWIVISGCIFALQQFRLISIQREITELVRQTAILDASRPSRDPNG